MMATYLAFCALGSDSAGAGKLYEERKSVNDFRSIKVMVQYGDAIAIGAAGVVFALSARTREDGGRPSLLRGALLALAVGLGVKNLTDGERLVAAPLMPR